MKGSVIAGIVSVILGACLIYATAKSIKKNEDSGPTLSYQELLLV
jgi:hypothetical protein